MIVPRNRHSANTLDGGARGVARGGRWPAAILVVLAIATLCAGCREVFRSLGPSSATLDTKAEQLFGALAARYTGVEREPKYLAARDRMTRTALVPSKIFDDTSVWTLRPSAVLRMLLVQGALEDGHYRFTARSSVTRPARPGDSRHIITLGRLTSNEFVWDTAVDFSLGTFAAADVGTLTAALLGSAEDRSEGRDVRADYRAAAPRAAAVMSALFSIDSIHTTPFSDGTTDVVLTIGISSDDLKKRYPAFGDYVAKYVNPARFHLTLTERGGAVWFDVSGGDRKVIIHYRTARGRLVPLYGASRSRPDTMELHADFTTRFKIFTVGMRNLVSDFVITNTPHERAWTIVSRREPQWSLPLVSERLLRTPLRRPFEDAGVIFHLGVRDSADAQTLLERRSHVIVQESAILRFLNALGSRAMSDLADRTEREEEQFFHEVFTALEADAHALGVALGAATNKDMAAGK
jgi:hypothetical protein